MNHSGLPAESATTPSAHEGGNGKSAEKKLKNSTHTVGKVHVDAVCHNGVCGITWKPRRPAVA